MPLFIGASKSSRNHKRITTALKKIVSDKKFIEEVNNDLKKKIKEIETQHEGVVPPEFIRKDSAGILTPADEIEQDKK